MSGWAAAASALVDFALDKWKKESQPVDSGKGGVRQRPTFDLTPVPSLMNMIPLTQQAQPKQPAASPQLVDPYANDGRANRPTGNTAMFGPDHSTPAAYWRDRERGGRSYPDPSVRPKDHVRKPVQWTFTGSPSSPQDFIDRGYRTKAEFDAWQGQQPDTSPGFTDSQLWEMEMKNRYKRGLREGQTVRPILHGLTGGWW